MIKDKRNIDALFEEGLKHLKEKPPAYTWDKLDKGLDRVKFKKSMVYIRWIAASVLIILAFGAGYYYAIYNLNTPEIADDSNLSTSASQNTKLANPQSIQDTKDNFSEISVTEQPETNNSQAENTNLPSLNNEILATNINNEFIDSENLIDVLSKQDKSTDEIRHMKKIGMANIPGPINSVFRFYLSPTLTVGLGMAICWGQFPMAPTVPPPVWPIPYPPPIGNCMVTAVNPLGDPLAEILRIGMELDNARLCQ